ncbi:uncharacterized protein LOC134523732 [Chroicocephalus ridibundus]|uniref:uncharacterized protein LOC134523732 n=1 Tax=Chroicocephalus ridibundus TaxID=1192867 RepID=UPI002FDE6232
MVVSPCTLLGRATLVTLPAELGLLPCLLRLWREGKTRTSVNTRVQFTLSFVTAFLQGLELAAAAVWSVATEETGFAVGHHQLPRRGWGQVSVMQRGRQPLRFPSAPECGDRGQNKPISLHLCSEDLSSLTFRRQPVRCFHPFPATSPQAPEDRLCVKNCFFCRTLCWTHIHCLNLLSSGLNRYSLFTSYGPTLPGLYSFCAWCCSHPPPARLLLNPLRTNTSLADLRHGRRFFSHQGPKGFANSAFMFDNDGGFVFFFWVPFAVFQFLLPAEGKDEEGSRGKCISAKARGCREHRQPCRSPAESLLPG